MRNRNIVFFVLALVCLMSSAAQAQTDVGGTITADTTWTLAGSPYRSVSSLIVDTAATLTIEHGVRVEMGAGHIIEIRGVLIARGTADQPIVLTSAASAPAPGDWDGIHFLSSAQAARFDSNNDYTGGSILEYVTVEYGSSVNIAGQAPFVKNSTFKNNDGRALYLNSIVDATELRIEDSTFEHNITGGALALFGPASHPGTVRVVRSAFVDNKAQGSGGWGSGGAISCGNVGALIVQGSRFVGNTGQSGGAISTSCGVHIAGCLFQGNDATYGGAYKSDYNYGDTLIEGSLFIDNHAVQGGAIYHTQYRDAADTITDQNNVFIGNRADIEAGAVLFYNTHASLLSSLLAFNRAGYYGGGLEIWANVGQRYEVVGNSFVGNQGRGGAALYAMADSRFDVCLSSTCDLPITGNTFADNVATGALSSNVNATPAASVATYYNNFRGSHLVANNFFGTISGPGLSAENVDIYVADGLSASDADNGSSDGDYMSTAPSAVWDWFDDSSKDHFDVSNPASAPLTAPPIAAPHEVVLTPTGVRTATLSWQALNLSDLAGYLVVVDADRLPPYDQVIDAGLVTQIDLSNLPSGDTFVGLAAYDTDFASSSDDAATLWVDERQTAGHLSAYVFEFMGGLRWGPDPLVFDPAYSGVDAPAQVFTLTNRLGEIVDLGAAAIGGVDASVFSIEQDLCSGISLAADASCSVQVAAHTPSSPGSLSAELSLTTSASRYSALSVPISGEALARGIASVTPTALHFAAVRLDGATSSQSFVLKNSGSGPLLLQSASLSGASASEFAVDASDCADAIAVDENCSITVELHPVAAGDKSAQLTLVTNDPLSPQLSVDLSAVVMAYAPVLIDQLGASSVAGVAPLAVDFSAHAIGGSGAYRYLWDFDDGGSGVSDSVQHTFADPGDYAVSLRVEDRADASNAAEISLTIHVVTDLPSPYGVEFKASPSQGEAPLDVTYTATLSGNGDFDLIWELGVGSAIIQQVGAGESSQTKRYDQAGDYRATLTASPATQSGSPQTVLTVSVSVRELGGGAEGATTTTTHNTGDSDGGGSSSAQAGGCGCSAPAVTARSLLGLLGLALLGLRRRSGRRDLT